MKPLAKYYTPDVPIQRDIHALSDPWLDVNADRADVNELVLNIVIKYLAEYLGLPQQDIEKIKAGVEVAMSPDKLEALSVIANSFLAMDGVDIPADELLASGCLCDIRSTAALFKEIAFHQRYNDRQTFVSMDLGSGSGILMIASIVAARRRGIRESIHIGFDTQIEAVRNSRWALMNTVMGEGVEIIVECGDVLRPDLWKIFNTSSLSHWISETISHTTPKMRITDNGDIEYFDDLKARIDMRVNRLSDPFVGVVANTVLNRGSFFRDVRDGRTAMFPDLINGRLQLDRQRTRLALETALDTEPKLLHEVGEEFDDYEDFGIKGRWGDPSDLNMLEEKLNSLIRDIKGSLGAEDRKSSRKYTKSSKGPDRDKQKRMRKQKKKDRAKKKKRK